MPLAARSVYERWARAQVDDEAPDLIGVRASPASADALDAFAARHDVKLPASFRALYGLSNGTSTMDGCENIFWPLDAMSASLKAFDIEDTVARWIGFADFRLQLVVYYMRIDRADGVWIDTHESEAKLPDRMQPIADSFEQFLERYVDDPLYWTGG